MGARPEQYGPLLKCFCYLNHHPPTSPPPPPRNIPPQPRSPPNRLIHAPSLWWELTNGVGLPLLLITAPNGEWLCVWWWW